MVTTRSSTSRIADTSRSLPLLHALAGLLLGAAFSTLLDPSPVVTACIVVGAAVAAAAAHGLPNVLVSAVVALGAISTFVQLIVAVNSRARMPSALVVLVMGLIFGVFALVFGRVSADSPRRLAHSRADVVFAATATGFAIAFKFAFPAIGVQGHLPYLLPGEDNAAWVNIVAALGGNHRGTISAASMSTLGPSINSFLAALTAVSRHSPVELVMAAFGCLFVLVPVVVGAAIEMTARTVSWRATAAVWATGSVLLGSFGLVFLRYGFLSTFVAQLLLVLSCALVSRAFTPNDGVRVHRASALFVLYCTGAIWFPLIPLVAVGLAAVVLSPIASRARTVGLRTTVAASMPSLVPAAVLGAALALQLHAVLGASDASAVLMAVGGTPGASPLFLVVIYLLAGIVSVAEVRQRAKAKYLIGMCVLLAIIGYSTAITFIDVVVGGGSHYGSTKLTYVSLGTLAMMASTYIARTVEGRRTGVAVLLVMSGAVLVSASPDGPIAGARSELRGVTASPDWGDAALTIRTGTQVVCIDTAVPKPNETNGLLAYRCTRWASSIAGTDGALSLRWRFLSLGRTVPTSAAPAPRDAVEELIVIGDVGQLHDPSAWWEPLMQDQTARLVAVPRSESGS